MEFDWVELVRATHVIAAAIWVGGAFLGLLVVGPGVQAAGASGRAFMGTLMQRGGFARLLGPASGVAILAGIAVYWARGYWKAPFATLSTSMLTVGAILGLAVLVLGMTFIMPMQKKLMAMGKDAGPGGPSPESAAAMQAMAATVAKWGKAFTWLLGVAFLLMAARNVVS